MAQVSTSSKQSSSEPRLRKYVKDDIVEFNSESGTMKISKSKDRTDGARIVRPERESIVAKSYVFL